MDQSILISDTFGFVAKKSLYTIPSYKTSVDNYNKAKSKAFKLGGSTPIFLDTNVLLRIYSISFIARERLKKFFVDYGNKIYITNQVQKEFVKNREDVIDNFFSNVTLKLPEAFQKDVLNKIDSYLNNNKIVLKDYDSFATALEKIKTQAESLNIELTKEVEKKEKEKQTILYKDPYLEEVSKMGFLPPLGSDELDLLKRHFDNLSKELDKDKIQTDIEKPAKAFPGMGDILKKPKDPYGDFIIYHELLKYMSENDTDAIFLTYDSAKGDWMQKNKQPHLHYLENAYLNTGKCLFILDAERVLEDLLDISLKSLISNPDVIPTELLDSNISVRSVRLFFNSYEPFESIRKPELIHGWFISELKENGFTTIRDLFTALERVKMALEHYPTERLSQIGATRAGLSILMPNFKRVFGEGNLTKYEAYRKYLDES